MRLALSLAAPLATFHWPGLFSALCRARGEPRIQQPSEPEALLATADTPSGGLPRSNSRGSWAAGAGRSRSRGGTWQGPWSPRQGEDEHVEMALGSAPTAVVKRHKTDVLEPGA